MTQYIFTVAAEDLDVALQIEAIRMRGVLDTEAAWRQERGAIEREVAQDLSNPQYVLYARLLATLFAGTPYAHDALGTRESFEKITGAMLKKFYETWYAPNNAILVIVGDVEPEPIVTKIRQLFGAIAPKKLPRRPDIALRPATPHTLHLDTDLPYGLAVVAVRMPGFDDPDYAAAPVLANVLSNPRGVLQDRVIAGKALETGFSFEPLPRAGFAFAAAAFPQGQAAPPTLGELKAALKSVTTGGVDADLVAAAKRRVVTHAELEKTSIPGLAAAWSHALAVEGRQTLDDEVALIERVVPADVDRVARRYLKLDRAVVAILTPRPSGTATLAGSQPYSTM